MVLRAWMKREQWFIWIVLAILLTLVLAAIGYLAGWWDKLPVSAVLWRCPAARTIRWTSEPFNGRPPTPTVDRPPSRASNCPIGVHRVLCQPPT